MIGILISIGCAIAILVMVWNQCGILSDNTQPTWYKVSSAIITIVSGVIFAIAVVSFFKETSENNKQHYEKVKEPLYRKI